MLDVNPPPGSAVLVTSKTPELSRPGIVFSSAAAAVTADSRVPLAASHPGLHAIKPGHHLPPPLFPPRLSAMKLALATLALLATAAASGYGGRVGKLLSSGFKKFIDTIVGG